MPTYQDSDGRRYWFDEPPNPAEVRADLVLVPDDAAPASEPVPDMVEARQLLRVLLEDGLLDTIDAFVATQPRAVQIDWQRAIYFKRDHALLNAMAMQMGYTQERVDGWFIRAAKMA